MSVFNTLKGMLPVEVTDALGDEITRSDSIAEQSYASRTIGDLHIYVNSSTGLDTNDGLSESKPKLTIQAAVDIIPDILNHNVALHLRGTFTGSSVFLYGNFFGASVALVIDGGTGVSVVDDNGGSNYTADISSTSSIGDSGQSWTTNEHRGYIVEVLTGAAAGDRRLIFSSDGTTIVPVANFSANPGAGAQFRIVRPETDLQQELWMSPAGNGAIAVQNLSLSGTLGRLYFYRTSTPAYVCNVISTSTSSYPIWANECILTIMQFCYDPDTFSLSFFTGDLFGCSILAGGGLIMTSQRSGKMPYTSVLNKFTIEQAHMSYMLDRGVSIYGGLNLVGMTMSRITQANGDALFTDRAGYRDSIITNGSGPGIRAIKSELHLDAMGDISNCSGHGIDLNQSKLYITGAFPGSANTGAGVYLHSGSFVEIANGSPPTLTGTVGDVSFDESTASTWASIDGGTPATDVVEMSSAKEV